MAILGLLEDRDLHGYEIRRQLRDNLGILANVSFGSIYPALTRLEKAGAVVATDGSSGAPGAGQSPAVPEAPPTGSLSGELAVLRARRHTPSRARRGKKVYRITEAGRLLFTQLLTEGGSIDDARSFSLRLAFARHLAPQARLALLERRRAVLVQRLAEADSSNVELDVYARSVVQHTADSVTQDIIWLDRLIAAERAATGPVPVPVTMKEISDEQPHPTGHRRRRQLRQLPDPGDHLLPRRPGRRRRPRPHARRARWLPRPRPGARGRLRRGSDQGGHRPGQGHPRRARTTPSASPMSARSG